MSHLQFLLTGSLIVLPLVAAEPIRPNILWITSEDNGPHLGCYGDRYATTPNLDRLAARSVRYLNVWCNAPVCAPARTAIITGLYPTSLGAEHMRSLVKLPRGMKLFPQLLREAGYYCSNNSKEDYNVEKPGQVWDESSGQAHWRNRQPGQPFFAVFNHLQSHESQVRKRPHRFVHDPANAPVPAYHPDTPEVRQDWAQYYDTLTEIDAKAGENLRELEEAGLAEDSIIFYYGDNGFGLPRGKRSACNSGLAVPLIVYVPPKLRHLASPDYAPGGTSDRLASFVDLAPTVLSLAGIRPSDYLQGCAFMGAFLAPPPVFLHGFRGRMDERIDFVRSVRDQRYVYVRNYLPHRIPGQHVAYLFETPTTQVWKRLYDEGKLNPPQTFFWEPKAPEELYDLERDPDEVNNLATSPAHRAILERMRKAQQEHARAIRDVGFLPEDEIHTRAAGTTPYEAGHDRRRYPLKEIQAAAELASAGKSDVLPKLKKLLRHPDSAVRYWAATGILIRGRAAVEGLRPELLSALQDDSPSVRVVAAEALGRHGRPEDVPLAMKELLDLANAQRQRLYVGVAALNAIDELDAKAAAFREAIAALPPFDKKKWVRSGETADRLVPQILDDLKDPEWRVNKRIETR
jgi:uncharacterized sulfatase